jgi:hypothetical protein
VARWFFARESGGDEPIKYGEVIAIGNGRVPSFLEYAHRTIGVNLEYSNRAKYQWVIAGGPEGTDVLTRERIAIFNMKASPTGKPLLFFDRTAGGDLGWPDSKTWTEQAWSDAWGWVKDQGPKALLALL